MKIFFKLLMLAVIFTSCEDVEPTIFNGSPENATFLSFSRTAYSLAIERDQTGTLDVIVNSSTVKNYDRTYGVEVLPNSSETAANPATYNVPATVTIPAGSYQGVLTITGTDGGLVDEEVKSFQIQLTNLTDEDIDQTVALVNVFEVCALQSPFLGEYLVEQITPNHPVAQAPAIQEGIVVTLVEGPTPYDREFAAQPYPGYGLPQVTFPIAFRCDFVNLGERVDSGIGCGSTIKFKPTDNPVPYNTADDSTFDVVFTEDSGSSCGNPRQVRLRFTKVVD